MRHREEHCIINRFATFGGSTTKREFHATATLPWNIQQPDSRTCCLAASREKGWRLFVTSGSYWQTAIDRVSCEIWEVAHSWAAHPRTSASSRPCGQLELDIEYQRHLWTCLVSGIVLMMGLSGCPQNVLFGRCSRDPCVYLEAADHLGASGCTFLFANTRVTLAVIDSDCAFLWSRFSPYSITKDLCLVAGRIFPFRRQSLSACCVGPYLLMSASVP